MSKLGLLLLHLRNNSTQMGLVIAGTGMYGLLHYDIEALKKCQKEQSEAIKGLSSVVMKKEGEAAVKASEAAMKATEAAVVPDKK